MLLNERSTALDKRLGRIFDAMGASVAIMPRRVAMFGWIMPAPFVMPAILYVVEADDGSLNVREMSLGNVSVVQIARAAVSQWS